MMKRPAIDQVRRAKLARMFALGRWPRRGAADPTAVLLSRL